MSIIQISYGKNIPLKLNSLKATNLTCKKTQNTTYSRLMAPSMLSPCPREKHSVTEQQWEESDIGSKTELLSILRDLQSPKTVQYE